MSARINVVLGKFSDSSKIYAFEAPMYCGIKKGDIIIVAGKDENESKLTVVDVHDFSMDYNKEEFDFLCTAMGATLPLKRVIGKIIRKDFTYGEDNEDE